MSGLRPILRLVLLALLVSVSPAPEARAHPQDGPHADLRLVVSERTVTWNIGINLAFADEVVNVSREAPDVLDPSEESALEDALVEQFTRTNSVIINGVEAEPTLREFTIGRADAALLPLFPRTGWRALTRFVCVLEYPAPEGVTDLEVTWNGYPVDVLAAESDPDHAPPPMTIQALLQAEGRVEIVRFIESVPTVSWHAQGADPAAGLLPVPNPPEEPASGSPRAPLWYASAALCGLGALVGVVLLAASRSSAGARRLAGLVLLLLGVFGGGLFYVNARTEHDAEAGPMFTHEYVADDVIAPLLHNTYEAFAHTDESVIYDLLARSADGEVLDRLFREVYSAMVVSDHDQARAIIAGVEPGEITLLDEGPDTFTVEASWEATGSVYHWGHSHDRTYAYRARMVVSAIDHQWKITGLTITDQRRLPNPDDAPPPELPAGFEL